MAPFTLCLNIFSLNRNNRNQTKKDNCRNVATKVLLVIFFGCVVSYTLYFKVRYVYSELNISISITDTIQQIFDLLQYIVDLIFVFKYGRDVSVEYYKQYECIDSILGEGHHSSDERRVLRHAAFFIVVWLASSLCDFIAWYLSYGIITPLVFSIAYVFLLIKIITMLDLSTQVIEIECRLRKILDKVRHYYEGTDYSANLCINNSLRNDTICNKNWFYAKNKVSMQIKDSFEIPSIPHILGEAKCLNWCYLLLTEQVSFINRMFGFRILLNSLSLLIDMVRFANISVRFLIGQQRSITQITTMFPVVSNLMRLLTCIAVIASLVNHCERVYSVRSKISGMLDHLLIIKNPGKELRESASALRDLMDSRPVSFNMANFFILNYSFLTSTVSIVVTYTIILLQTIE